MTESSNTETIHDIKKSVVRMPPTCPLGVSSANASLFTPTDSLLEHPRS